MASTFGNRIRKMSVMSGVTTAAWMGASLVFGSLLTSPLYAQAPCEDISGVYDVLVSLPGGGPTQIELDLTQTECEMTGFVGLRMRTPIRNGVVEESTASFTFEAQNQGSGGTLEIRWEITVDGDDVTGTFSHDLFGSIEVTGTRVERRRQ